MLIVKYWNPLKLLIKSLWNGLKLKTLLKSESRCEDVTADVSKKRQTPDCQTSNLNNESPSGVNFINIFCKAFIRADPKSVKWYWWLDWVLTLSGSACVKAAHRMLMKLTLGVNFINILQAAFAHVNPKSTKRLGWLDFLFARSGSDFVKALRKHVGVIDPR